MSFNCSETLASSNNPINAFDTASTKVLSDAYNENNNNNENIFCSLPSTSSENFIQDESNLRDYLHGSTQSTVKSVIKSNKIRRWKTIPFKKYRILHRQSNKHHIRKYKTISTKIKNIIHEEISTEHSHQGNPITIKDTDDFKVDKNISTYDEVSCSLNNEIQPLIQSYKLHKLSNKKEKLSVHRNSDDNEIILTEIPVLQTTLLNTLKRVRSFHKNSNKRRKTLINNTVISDKRVINRNNISKLLKTEFSSDVYRNELFEELFGDKVSLIDKIFNDNYFPEKDYSINRDKIKQGNKTAPLGEIFHSPSNIEQFINSEANINTNCLNVQKTHFNDFNSLYTNILIEYEPKEWKNINKKTLTNNDMDTNSEESNCNEDVMPSGIGAILKTNYYYEDYFKENSEPNIEVNNLKKYVTPQVECNKTQNDDNNIDLNYFNEILTQNESQGPISDYENEHTPFNLEDVTKNGKILTNYKMAQNDNAANDTDSEINFKIPTEFIENYLNNVEEVGDYTENKNNYFSCISDDVQTFLNKSKNNYFNEAQEMPVSVLQFVPQKNIESTNNTSSTTSRKINTTNYIEEFISVDVQNFNVDATSRNENYLRTYYVNEDHSITEHEVDVTLKLQKALNDAAEELKNIFKEEKSNRNIKLHHFIEQNDEFLYGSNDMTLKDYNKTTSINNIPLTDIDSKEDKTISIENIMETNINDINVTCKNIENMLSDFNEVIHNNFEDKVDNFSLLECNVNSRMKRQTSNNPVKHFNNSKYLNDSSCTQKCRTDNLTENNDLTLIEKKTFQTTTGREVVTQEHLEMIINDFQGLSEENQDFHKSFGIFQKDTVNNLYDSMENNVITIITNEKCDKIYKEKEAKTTAMHIKDVDIQTQKTIEEVLKDISEDYNATQDRFETLVSDCNEINFLGNFEKINGEKCDSNILESQNQSNTSFWQHDYSKQFVEKLTDPHNYIKTGLDNIRRDASLLYDRENPHQLIKQQNNTEKVLDKIKSIFNNLIDNVQSNVHLKLRIRNRRDWKNCIFMNDRLILKSEQNAKMNIISYNSLRNRKKFNIIIFLLGKIAQLLSSKSTCTRREIYYQYKSYFKKQNVIDNAVADISCLLDMPPWELGLFATSKGLVYGNVLISVTDEEVINCNVRGGVLIPQDCNNILKVETEAFFLLIVEKDSIFNKLLDEDLPNKLVRPFIMITGKGFADMSTRLFIKKLWTILSIPVFALVDADPFGIDIMLNYRFGSLASAHLSDYLATPSIRWIGVYPSEITSLKIKRQPLTKRDQSKVKELLSRPYISAYPKIKEQILLMLTKSWKAEIEGLVKYEQFLSDIYLPTKFYSQDYI